MCIEVTLLSHCLETAVVSIFLLIWDQYFYILHTQGINITTLEYAGTALSLNVAFIWAENNKTGLTLCNLNEITITFYLSSLCIF